MAEDGACVGELGVRGRVVRDAKDGELSLCALQPGAHLGEDGQGGQGEAAQPFACVFAQRFASGVADQCRAVADIVGGAVELGVGEQGEPGPEGRPILCVEHGPARTE